MAAKSPPTPLLPHSGLPCYLLRTDLDHEVPDGAMEHSPIIVPHVAEGQEVLTRAGDDVTVQLEVDVAWVVDGEAV